MNDPHAVMMVVDQAAGPPDPSQLQLVLRTPNLAAFYDRNSRELILHSSSATLPVLASTSAQSSNSLALLPHRPPGPLTTTSSFQVLPATCPTCLRPLSLAHHDPASNGAPHSRNHSYADTSTGTGSSNGGQDDPVPSASQHHSYVAPDYFRLLASASIPPSRATSRPGTPIVALVANEHEDQEEEEEEYEEGNEGAVSDETIESANAIRLDDQVAIEAELRRKAASHRVADGPVGVGIPGTPPRQRPARPDRPSTLPKPNSHKRQRLQASQFSQGYFDRFFVKVRKLGRGARGTVWLCQHVLAGQQLGEYAVKQVPVGDYTDNLLASLKEVQMLETLRHPNVIHYQHAWIEEAQTSPFTPRVPTLHVLMMAANGGSLADWISARAGNPITRQNSENLARPHSNISTPPHQSRVPGDLEQSASSSTAGFEVEPSYPVRRLLLGAVGQQAGQSLESLPSDPPSPRVQEQKVKNERLKDAIRAQRMRRRMNSVDDKGSFEDDADTNVVGIADAGGSSVLFAHSRTSPSPPQAQHLLGEEELYSLLRDMASGLGWLHDRGVLHLDVKPENVLLHWEQADDMLPRAMLSDFGSSTFLQGNWRRIRSGHTGTMDFMAPEAIFPDRITGQLKELTSKSDIWSLGMILHLCVFFRLPYYNSDDVDKLRSEMEVYPGYTAQEERSMHRARVPPTLSVLLCRMLDRVPSRRPTCAEILAMLDAAPPSAAKHVDAEGQRMSPSTSPRRPGTGLGAASATTTTTTSHLISGALTLRKRARRGTGPDADGEAGPEIQPPAPLPLPPTPDSYASWTMRVIRAVIGGLTTTATAAAAAEGEADRGGPESWWMVMLIMAEARTIVLLQWVVEGSGTGGVGTIRGGGRAIITVGLVEVALISRRPAMAWWYFTAALTIQVLFLAIALSRVS